MRRNNRQIRAELDHEQQMLESLRQRLFILEEQQALTGLNTRPEVIIEAQRIRDTSIPEHTRRVAELEGELADRGLPASEPQPVPQGNWHWLIRLGLALLAVAFVIGRGASIRMLWANGATSSTSAAQGSAAPAATAANPTTYALPEPIRAAPIVIKILGFQLTNAQGQPVVYQPGQQISARGDEVIEITVLIDHPVDGLTFSWTTLRSGTGQSVVFVGTPSFVYTAPKKAETGSAVDTVTVEITGDAIVPEQQSIFVKIL